MNNAECEGNKITAFGLSGNPDLLNDNALRSKSDKERDSKQGHDMSSKAGNSSNILQQMCLDNGTGVTNGVSGRGTVPVIESVFSLQSELQTASNTAKKTVALCKSSALKVGAAKCIFDIPTPGSKKSQVSVFHEHTMYRMANADFFKKDDNGNLKFFFKNLIARRATESFHQLTERCYTLVRDRMMSQTLFEKCEMLLAMKRFVEDFDR